MTRNDKDPEGDALAVSLRTPATVGTATCGGGCTYQPPPTPPGGTFPYTATFAYDVDDGHGGTSHADVIVTVNDNGAPDARNDAMTAPGHDAPFSASGLVKPLPNDTDPEGDTFTIEDWSDGSDGSVGCYPPTPQLPWHCVYTPDPGFVGTDTFTYTIDDGHGSPPGSDDGRDTATVTVRVSANRPPKANDDEIVVHNLGAEGLAVTINDLDPDDDGTSVIAMSDSDAQGTVVCGGDCTYTPPPGFAGPYPLIKEFDYTISDGRGGTDQGHVKVTLLPNLGPTARDDRGSARFGDPTTIAVTGNDTDPEGDLLTVVNANPTVTPAGRGIATCGGSSCSFRAPPGVFGEATFSYTVEDGNGGQATANVSVEVIQNRAPIALPDSGQVTTETHKVLFPLSNDSDPDDDDYRLFDWTNPSKGAVTCEVSCTYTPRNGATGIDSFTYTITDDRGGFATATVTITIGANRPPTAVDDPAAGVDTRTTWIAVVGNDDDPDDDPLRVTAHTEPEHGTVDCTVVPDLPNPPPPRTYCTYTLDSDYAGPLPIVDTFEYTVSDGKAGEDVALVTVTTDTNRGPVTTEDEVHAHGLAPAPFAPLANDNDPDQDPMTLVAVDSPRVGCSGSACVYTPPISPPGGYPYTESFDYHIVDAQGHPATGTINVEVIANQAPVAEPDPVTTREGREVQFDVLGNDHDPDQDPLTITEASAPSHGTLECPSSDWEIQPACTYAPDPGYLGTDTFTYTIDDSYGETASATVTITMVPFNTPVVAGDDEVTIYRSVTTTCQVVFLVDPDRGEGRREAHGMRGVGQAAVEHLRLERLGDVMAHGHGAQGQV